ncbi:hypothetical protein R1flu_027736 [Riccia fluitans]|uniref:Uncharacterized protein n=1 Tax=Riccia fluitans TaxID=41844 RepID=A0ABD1XNR0_9MARC
MAEGGGYFQSGGFHLPHHQQHHQGHVESPAYPPASTECKGELVKIFCQARPDYNLAVRDYEVVLVPGDDNDPYQTWIKDESWSTKVKDSAGFPAFALINKATGKALRHAEGMEAPVVLEEYEPNVLNEVILWTTSDDVSDGYKAIRPVNNIHLNLDADHGLEKYGGVKDGNKVIFFKWKHEPNQLWMFGHLEPREYESQAYIPPQHEQRTRVYPLKSDMTITRTLVYPLKSDMTITRTLVYTLKDDTIITRTLVYPLKDDMIITRTLVYPLKSDMINSRTLIFVVKNDMIITMTSIRTDLDMNAGDYHSLA